MAYVPLARKYRPKFFREVVGQEAAVRILKNAIKSDKVAHAYIFAGPRGVGKTTVARILAKALNCVNPVDGEPCGECENCKAITKGNFPDLIEIDAASNRGIDDIRQLKESVSYAPIKGKYKVYIIDEAHMLTKEAFNALLKTLEEPPPRTVFVLCTTELDRIIPTIQSRCQRIIFKKLPEKRIIEQLDRVCKEEGINHDGEALRIIARASEGCMRDALSLLDQAAIYCDNNVTASAVREFLGIVSEDRVAQFLKAFLKGDVAYCIEELQKLDEEGYNLTAFWKELHRKVFDELVRRKTGGEIPEGFEFLKEEPYEKLLYAERILSKALSESYLPSVEPLTVFKTAVLKADLLADLIPLGQLVKILNAYLEGNKPASSTEVGEKSSRSVTPQPSPTTGEGTQSTPTENKSPLPTGEEKTPPPQPEKTTPTPQPAERRETAIPVVERKETAPPAEKKTQKTKELKTPETAKPVKVDEKPSKPSAVELKKTTPVVEKTGGHITKKEFVNKAMKSGVVEPPLLSTLVKYLKGGGDTPLVLSIPRKSYEPFKEDIDRLIRFFKGAVKLEIVEEVLSSEKKFQKLRRDTRYLF